jgi:hypothetical protein
MREHKASATSDKKREPAANAINHRTDSAVTEPRRSG